MIRVSLWAKPSYSAFSLSSADLPTEPAYGLEPGHPVTWLTFHFCVTPSYKRTFGGPGILTWFPSSTPFGFDLGAD